jgi:hypothetical protein
MSVVGIGLDLAKYAFEVHGIDATVGDRSSFSNGRQYTACAEAGAKAAVKWWSPAVVWNQQTRRSVSAHIADRCCPSGVGPRWWHTRSAQSPRLSDFVCDAIPMSQWTRLPTRMPTSFGHCRARTIMGEDLSVRSQPDQKAGGK